jgi:hypothetical protein
MTGKIRIRPSTARFWDIPQCFARQRIGFMQMPEQFGLVDTAKPAAVVFGGICILHGYSEWIEGILLGPEKNIGLKKSHL